MTVTWETFPYFAWTALVLWAFSAGLAFVPARRRGVAAVSLAAGLLGYGAVAAFLALLWISLARPPLRTLGETRLWYAVLLPLCGFLIEWRWKARWLGRPCLVMAGLFIAVNLLNPEAHDRALMPALRSPWFVPHVIVYLLGYSLLGAAAVASVRGLAGGGVAVRRAADRLVLLGFVFITAGMVFGGMWAKVAWGHYWTWDPKETWALLTWLFYLCYLHVAAHRPLRDRTAFLLVLGGFAVLLVCWFGFNYLGAAQGSVHSYTSGG